MTPSFSYTSLHRIFLTFILLATQTFSLDTKFKACEPKSCGKGPEISFPFYLSGKQQPFCGYPSFELTCDDVLELPVLGIAGESYLIKNMSYEKQRLQVVNSRSSHDPCPSPMHNLTLHRTPFSVIPSDINFSILYNCSGNLWEDFTTYPLTCSGSSNTSLRSFGVFQRKITPGTEITFASGSCQKQVDVPVSASVESDVHLFLTMTYAEILKRGFAMNWTAHSCVRCNSSGGRCGTDDKEFVCLCPDGPSIHNTCRKGGRGIDWKLKIVISVVAVTVGLAVASIGWFVYHRRKTKSYRTSSTLLPKNISSEPSSKSSDIEKAEELLVGVRLFSYDELVEATSNFDPSKELGDGGFGTVYYGKLKDGRSVAVKRLYDNNFKRAEQFRNEVEILTGLRHPNLVSLFGCSSKQSRELLLVYEYVANGTLADHLHGPQANPSSLPWSIRLKIAVETASALKYLHASKIIHRDVKSNNILLDQNFNVKVADFGLSRLFPMDKTHVSTAPQGTPGYVDPDYHLCYQLSKKSDVYSFAVVLMELISSLPAVDITRTRQEINLSNMAVVKIQSHKLHEMVDPSLGFDTDTRVKETVIAVAELAFQCLQSDKDLRPCMSHVMETLTRIQNNGFGGSNMDDRDKSGPLAVQSPNSVIVKWDSK
ncbi:LEAF RUST 10 DISEASE-RESISTANCE LOCUS RECEPTOR-LIKE PROTEIN KINASE-like 1.2 isoform X1 [Raphanus sativus]|uniref:non-specific serine/threonine protein kinase n=1 Tax=Raphanus sativus TaxID=3726 RepID=A0A6J0JWB8_RAPSA|nr:LEAF RUST 10 DISEASE-RESISTANCE LOCUS RECEPTOR-LIKE PROTEIN KINASE-like 1.2 isoform X1 [Raphanus sativus]